MRSMIHAPYKRVLSCSLSNQHATKLICVTLLAGLASACSNDAMRFDEAMSVASTSPQSYQNTNANVVAAQPYPGDVDGMTTASVRAPSTRITPSRVPNVGYQTTSNGAYQPAYTRPAPLPVTRGVTPRPGGVVGSQSNRLVTWNQPNTSGVQVHRPARFSAPQGHRQEWENEKL